MQEDHQKILNYEVLRNVCAIIPIIKDLKYFELLRYGSYKSFMTQSRQIDEQF